MVQFLVNKGCDINKISKQCGCHGHDTVSESALHIAVRKGIENKEIIECLLQHGADIHMRNSNQETPLMVASSLGKLHENLVVYLINWEKKYDISVQSNNH